MAAVRGAAGAADDRVRLRVMGPSMVFGDEGMSVQVSVL